MGKSMSGRNTPCRCMASAIFFPPPVISPAGGVFANSLQITLSNTAPGASIFYSLDNTTPTTNSIPYTGPFTITHSTGVRVRAFQPNYVPSTMVFATFLSSNSIGSGTGLNGAYYSGQTHTFTNPPPLMRTDATINFDWSPARLIQPLTRIILP